MELHSGGPILPAEANHDQAQTVLGASIVLFPKPATELEIEVLVQQNKETQLAMSGKAEQDSEKTHGKQTKWTDLHVLGAVQNIISLPQASIDGARKKRPNRFMKLKASLDIFGNRLRRAGVSAIIFLLIAIILKIIIAIIVEITITTAIKSRTAIDEFNCIIEINFNIN